MINKNIGINTSFENCQENLRKMAIAGFKYAYLNEDIFAKKTDKAFLEVAKSSKDCGIELFSAHLTGNALPYSSKKSLNEVIKEKQEMIGRSSLLEVTRLTTHIGAIKRIMGVSHKEVIDRIGLDQSDRMNAEVLKTLCQYAAQYEITLAIENVPCVDSLWSCSGQGYAHTITHLRHIIELVNEPNIGICLDTGHANICGISLYQAILEAGTLLVETHFNDNFGLLTEGVNENNDLHRPPGIGNINWIEVIAGLHEICYSNPVIFELSSKENETFEDILNLTRGNWAAFELTYGLIKAFNKSKVV